MYRLKIKFEEKDGYLVISILENTFPTFIMDTPAHGKDFYIACSAWDSQIGSRGISLLNKPHTYTIDKDRTGDNWIKLFKSIMKRICNKEINIKEWETKEERGMSSNWVVTYVKNGRRA